MATAPTSLIFQWIPRRQTSLSDNVRSLIDESTWSAAESIFSRIQRPPLVTINLSPSIIPRTIYSPSSSRQSELPLASLQNLLENYIPEENLEEVDAGSSSSSSFINDSSSSSSSSREPIRPLEDYIPEGKQKEVEANSNSSSSSINDSSSSSRILEEANRSSPISSERFSANQSLSSLAQLRALGLHLRELRSHAHLYRTPNSPYLYKFSVESEAREFRLCLIKAGIDCSLVRLRSDNQLAVGMDSVSYNRLLHSSYIYSFSDIFEARHMIQQLRGGEIECSMETELIDNSDQVIWKISLTASGGHKLMDHPPIQMDSVEEEMAPEMRRRLERFQRAGGRVLYNSFDTFADVVTGVTALTIPFSTTYLAWNAAELAFCKTTEEIQQACKKTAKGAGWLIGGLTVLKAASLYYQWRRLQEGRYFAEG